MKAETMRSFQYMLGAVVVATVAFVVPAEAGVLLYASTGDPQEQGGGRKQEQSGPCGLGFHGSVRQAIK